MINIDLQTEYWHLVLELLEYVKNQDFEGMLKHFPEGIEYRSFKYQTADDFELAGSYEEDARYRYPARGIMIQKCLEYCIQELKK
jgi:hypothetical protein